MAIQNKRVVQAPLFSVNKEGKRMKKVFLHGELGKRFGSEWDLHVKSPIEAVHALFANNPKIEKYLNQKHQQNIYYGIKKEGSEDFTEKEEYFLDSNKDFHVFPLPQGASLGALVMTAITTAASMYLSKKIAEAMERDDQALRTQTKSYIYNGTQNRYQQGNSIPVGYGILKVGANVISSSNISYDFNSEKNKILNFTNGLYSLIPSYSKYYYQDLGPLFSCFALNVFDGSSKSSFIDPAAQYIRELLSTDAFGTPDGLYGGFKDIESQTKDTTNIDKEGNDVGGYFYYKYNYAKGVKKEMLGNFDELQGNWYPNSNSEVLEGLRYSVTASNALSSSLVCLQSVPKLQNDEQEKVFYPILFSEEDLNYLKGNMEDTAERKETTIYPIQVGERWRGAKKENGVGWYKLESLSVLKSIDLLSEGEIDGFSDNNGNLLPFSENSTQESSLQNLRFEDDDFLQAVFLNDTPVKEVDESSTYDSYNINEFDIDIARNKDGKIGAEDQSLLEPQYLFTSHTKEKNHLLYGPRILDFQVVSSLVGVEEFEQNKLFIKGQYVSYEDLTYETKKDFSEIFDPNKNYYANEGNRYSSEVYHINDNDSIEYYIPTESINEYKQFSGEYVNEDTVYVEGDKIKNQKADSSIYGYYKMGADADKFLGIFNPEISYDDKAGHIVMKETIKDGPNLTSQCFVITGNVNPAGLPIEQIGSGIFIEDEEGIDRSSDLFYFAQNHVGNVTNQEGKLFFETILVDDTQDPPVEDIIINEVQLPLNLISEEIDITPGETVDSAENLWDKILINSPIDIASTLNPDDEIDTELFFQKKNESEITQEYADRIQEENYSSHTIINTEVEQALVTLRVDELSYIYEGDHVEVTYQIGKLWRYLLAAWTVIQTAKVVYHGIKGIIAAVKAASLSAEAVAAAASPFTTHVAGFKAKEAGEESQEAAERGMLAAKAAPLAAVLATLYYTVFDKDYRWKIGTKIENAGELWPNKARFRIKYGNEGEGLYSTDIYIYGVASSSYKKDIKIYLPPNPNNRDRIIKVYKLNRERNIVKEGEQSARYKEIMYFDSITEIIPTTLNYPNSVIIGTRINAKDQPNIPERNYNLRLKKVQVPSNYDTETRQYTGNWNGIFNPELKWTNNPAWCLYDLISNKRFGVGKFGIKQENIDRWTLYKVAKYCDELVLTGYSPKYQKRKPSRVDDIEGLATYQFNLEVESFSLELQHIGKQLSIFHEDGSYESIKIQKADPTQKTISLYSEPKHENFECAVSIDYPILEPRYTLNAFIMNQENAFKLINEFAVIFRAYAYWSGGAINFFQDEKKEAVMLFSNNNISDKGFSYSSTPRTSRSNSCNIKYIDRYNKYRPKIEHAEDREAIEENGFVEQSVDGFGITSQAQAKRAAEFIIKGANLETEMITFSTNMAGSYLKPGDIIDVIDNKKTVGRFAGKIIDTKVHERGFFAELTIDYPIYTFIDKHDKETWKTIKIYQPTGNETIASLDSTQDVTDEKIDNIRAAQIGEFLIYDTADDNTTLKVFNNVFSFAEGGYQWHEALRDAKEKGGKLAAIEDQDTQFLIESILPTGEVAWIGGYNKEKPAPEEIIWHASSSCSDNEISYSNWSEGFPKFSDQLTTDNELTDEFIVTEEPELSISADVEGSLGNFLAISGSSEEERHGEWIHMEHTHPTGYIFQNISNNLLDNIEDSEGASFHLEDSVNYANSKQYKILNIQEESNGIFNIQGLEYNVDKFDNIEKDLSINRPNYPVIFNSNSSYEES